MTLIDSRPAIMAAWAALASETGTGIDLAEVDRRMGIKLEDEVARWFPAADLGLAAAIYRRHYVELAPRLTTAMPGMHEAVAAVRQAGESAVIVTAKHPVSVQPSLVAVGLQVDEVFTHVHGHEKAAVLSRIHAAVYVGDTPADMTAAVDAGARAMGVPTGSFTGQELADAGASVVLHSLHDFPSAYACWREQA
jgi:phosphoglycolate phosphatase